jgi:hypothetical protein
MPVEAFEFRYLQLNRQNCLRVSSAIVRTGGCERTESEYRSLYRTPATRDALGKVTRVEAPLRPLAASILEWFTLGPKRLAFQTNSYWFRWARCIMQAITAK